MSKYPFEIQFLSDCEFDAHQNSSEEFAPVVLCGSLVSSFEPTNIPNGMALSAALLNSLFSDDKKTQSVFTDEDISRIQKVYYGELNVGSSMPFEILFHDCPYITPIKEMLYEYFSHRKYNALHYSLIDLMKNGKIAAIITPNYDECFNLAAKALYRDEFESRLKIIAKENDLSDMNNNPFDTIFYLHGCVCNDENDLVITMSDERLLPNWKNATLSRILQGRDLLIIGYSGLDFEICPALFNLMKENIIRRVIYNKYVPYGDGKNNIDVREQIAVASLTYNISSILSAEPMSTAKNSFIVGDVLETLNQYFGTNIQGLNMRCDSSEFLERLKKVLVKKPEARLLWALRILARMGCATQGIKLLTSMSILEFPESVSIEMAWISAAILYRAGQYKDASKLYCVCMKNIDSNRLENGLLAVQSLAIRNDLFENYRAGGYTIHAILIFFQVKHTLAAYRRKEIFEEDLIPIRATVFYRELGVYRRIISTYKFCPILLKKRITFLIVFGLNLSMQYGERILLQNFAQEFQLLSKYLGESICQSIRRKVSIDTILSMKENTKGFDEMGTLFEQIVYRRNLYIATNRKKDIFGYIRDTTEMPSSKKHLEYLSMISFLYGIFPEAYKCLALAEKDRLCIEGEYEISYKEIVNKCQYQWLKKWITLHNRCSN